MTNTIMVMIWSQMWVKVSTSSLRTTMFIITGPSLALVEAVDTSGMAKISGPIKWSISRIAIISSIAIYSKMSIGLGSGLTFIEAMTVRVSMGWEAIEAKSVDS